MSEAFPFLGDFINFLRGALSWRKERRDKFINATFLIDAAINRTLKYVDSNNYIPDPELSELWLNAAKEIFQFDRALSEMLVRKANFWALPDRWIRLGIDVTIIQLKELRELTEVLRSKIK